MAEPRLAGQQQPVATSGATFAPMVTTASLPDQPVANPMTAVSKASVESDIRYAVDLLGGQAQSGIKPPEGQRRSGWQKGRSRREDRDENAPRPPLTGYIRFLNEQREVLRKEQPDIPFTEATRILGTRWTDMPQAEKDRYRSEAQHDKIAYSRELANYKQTEAYSAFVQKKALVQKQQNEGKIEAPGFNLPIFTDEFLDYNKGKDLELQALRRANAEAEEKNSVLSNHIQQLKKIVSHLDQEAEQRQTANVLLEKKLNLLRTTIITKFENVSLPDSGLVAVPTSVDMYMKKLHSMLVDPAQASSNEGFLLKVKEIMASIDLEGMFSGVSQEQLAAASKP
ncbi:high mobility group protein 20A-like [Sycon ciliatum]|uniref:high mobility group protein 20A-like n=1 Tax=Sycon ciliatum TaxID=27933 RepID=UPI0031F686CA|eukprot:scpid22051/ scgid12449/ High mobility group protein 20A; HMG box-containing protein 20A; HMG domain-containing protein HMGX1; Inhibitor of BRAF35